MATTTVTAPKLFPSTERCMEFFHYNHAFLSVFQGLSGGKMMVGWYAIQAFDEDGNRSWWDGEELMEKAMQDTIDADVFLKDTCELKVGEWLGKPYLRMKPAAFRHLPAALTAILKAQPHFRLNLCRFNGPSCIWSAEAEKDFGPLTAVSAERSTIRAIEAMIAEEKARSYHVGALGRDCWRLLVKANFLTPEGRAFSDSLRGDASIWFSGSDKREAIEDADDVEDNKNVTEPINLDVDTRRKLLVSCEAHMGGKGGLGFLEEVLQLPVAEAPKKRVRTEE